MPRAWSYLATLCSAESTTAVTPGTVTDVSAMLVDTMMVWHPSPELPARDPARPRQEPVKRQRLLRPFAMPISSAPCVTLFSSAPGTEQSRGRCHRWPESSQAASAMVAPGEYLDLDRKRSAFRRDDRTVAQKSATGPASSSGRHHDDEPKSSRASHACRASARPRSV